MSVDTWIFGIPVRDTWMDFKVYKVWFNHIDKSYNCIAYPDSFFSDGENNISKDGECYKRIVSNRRELLIDFSKKVLFGEGWKPELPFENMVDEYLKGN